MMLYEIDIFKDPNNYFEIKDMLKEREDEEMIKSLREFYGYSILRELIKFEFWNWYYGEELSKE